MRRAVFLFWILKAMALTGHAADAQLVAQWPLTNSLLSSAGALNLDPYGGGSRLSDSAAVFEVGAVALGEITLFGTPVLSVDQGITVTGWIKPSEIGAGFTKTSPHTLVYLYDSTDRGGTQFIFRILDGKLNAFNATPAKNIYSSFSAPENEWSFFAFVLRTDSVDIFLNSYPPQATPISNKCQYDRIYFGAMDAGLARAYKGSMKNLRLYQGALEPEDVLGIYHFESGP